MRELILASSSPRRKEILALLGIPFSVEPSDYEEDMGLAMSPSELAETLATGKAEAVARKHADAIIIGADTFVELDGKLLGKPYTAERAKEMLRQLSGRTHNVLTGFCAIETKTGRRQSGVETTKVTFRELSEPDIEAYVSTEEPLLAAGAYMIQGGASRFVASVEGSYDNIMGLPLKRIQTALESLGVHG